MHRPPLPAVVACGLLAACATAPQPLRLPQLTVDVLHAAAPAREPAAEGSPQVVHIELLALLDAPQGPAADLHAAAITNQEGAPFRGASSLPFGTRWLVGEDFARWQALRGSLGAHQVQCVATADAHVIPGLTTRLAVADTGLPAVVLSTTGLPGGIAVELRAGSEQTEGSHLGSGIPPQGALVFAPAKATPSIAGYAMIVAIDAGAAIDAEAVAAARRRVSGAAATATAWPRAWREAFAAVGAHARRSALLALASPLHLDRCSDVLLIADDRALVDITQALDGVEPTAPNVAWQFERATWRALLSRLEREELPPALTAACRRHLGAAGIDASALRQAIATATDGDTFVALVREENLAALTSRAASHRVLAHEWLRGNGGCVPDFDPLATPDTRRQALRRFAAASAALEVAR